MLKFKKHKDLAKPIFDYMDDYYRKSMNPSTHFGTDTLLKLNNSLEFIDNIVFAVARQIGKKYTK